MPRPARVINDPSLLEAALEGLQLQRQRIDAQIQEVKLLLKQRRIDTPLDSGSHSMMPGRRELSDAARKRIAAAQRKRWAEYRKAAASQNKSGD